MLSPHWPAPSFVKALSLTKLDVASNYLEVFKATLLTQVHGSDVLSLPARAPLVGDGSYTTIPLTPCVIKTADCLAILLCNTAGTEVAALHAGWRGLAQGVIANGVSKFQRPPSELLAWISPGICANHYEVGMEVYQMFCSSNAAYEVCFRSTRLDHWFCDLNQLAHIQLQALGVSHIYTDHLCTYEDDQLFYSYRREPHITGRLLHGIWLE